MQCKDIDSKLTLYLLGDLDPAQTAEIKEHLASCDTCRAKAEALTDTLDLLRDALSGSSQTEARLSSAHRRRAMEPPRTAKKKRDIWFFAHHPGLAAAAGIVFFVGLIGAMLMPAGIKARNSIFKMGEVVGGLPLMRSGAFKAASEDNSAIRLGLDLYETEEIEALADDYEIDSGVVNGSYVNYGRIADEKSPQSAGETDRAGNDYFYQAGTTIDGRFVAPSATPEPSVEIEMPAPELEPLPPPTTPADFSPTPAEFDSVAITKSPLIMKGVYGARTPGARGAGKLGKGGGPSPTADSDGDGLSDDWSVDVTLGDEAPPQAVTPKAKSEASKPGRAGGQTPGWLAGTEHAVRPAETLGEPSSRTDGTRQSGERDKVASRERESRRSLTTIGGVALEGEKKSQSESGMSDSLSLVTEPISADTPVKSKEAPDPVATRWFDGGAVKEWTSEFASGPVPATRPNKARTQDGQATEAGMVDLNQVIIPEVDFKNASLKDVATFLEETTVTFDAEGGKKANIQVGESLKRDISTVSGDESGAALFFASPDTDDTENLPTVTFRAKNITAQEALDIVTQVTGTKVTEDQNGLRIVPMDAPEGNIAVREYEVDKEVAQKVIRGERGRRGDFIAIDMDDVSEDVADEFFKEMGVQWPAGSSVRYLPSVGKLVVANTEKNLEQVESTLSRIVTEDRSKNEEVPELETIEEIREEPPEPPEQITGPRFKATGVNPLLETSVTPFSTFAIDVDTAAYTLARNYMLQGYLPPAESVRTEEFVNYFEYGYKGPQTKSFLIHTEVAPSPFGRGKHMLKIGVKGRRLGREEQRPAVLTFLVDTSGSMDQADRIELVRESLALLLDSLSPTDQVALVQYDSHARIVLPHTPAAQKDAILAALNGVQCSGSTNLEEGMSRAYGLAASAFVPGAENRVLILSDGVANLGSGAAEDILASVSAYRSQGIYCSVFGFGMGNYDDTMLETLANKGNGSYAFIDSMAEARRVFVEDMAATLNTIAADVKIQVEFHPEYVTRYRQLGYENRQLTKEQFRDDTVDAGEVGSGQSVTALYELELTDTEATIATVRVRYRRTDNGRIEEVAYPVKGRDIVSSYDKAGTHFQLAACVAEFAEILRGSPFAAGSTSADVAERLRPVALDLPLDTRVQELLLMVQSADSLSRAPEGM